MSERLASEIEKESIEEKRIEHYEKSKNEPFKFSFGQNLTPDKEREFNEIISFLSPCKTALHDYQEQKPAKFTFKCLDGDIQISEYGILRTDFYYKERIKQTDFHQFVGVNVYLDTEQVRARENKEKGNIFNYEKFPKSVVKYFTDALFGIMPKCDDIISTIQLMNFLLFEGQATVGTIFKIIENME